MRKGFSAAILKWIAVISMVTDHFAVSVYSCVWGRGTNCYTALRAVGRIAFPIYCFLLVEGFCHTRSARLYLRNLVIFALISEIPFNMAVFGHIFYPKGQNVYFTLALGLCALLLLKRFEGFSPKRIFLQALIVAVFLALGQLLEVDYHWRGIAYIILFYYLRELKIGKGTAALVGAAAFALYERAAVLAFAPIYLYNGERGRQKKYLFYAIYPLHLLVLGALRMWVL